MPTAALQSLLADSAVRQIMDLIDTGGGEARIVGGAVRDALLGRRVGEIDLAATLPPETTAELLKQAGIKTVPTGIEFGTITAVIAKTGYEITTLRHDVETDGRRATVAYTDDWQADAARRDFTMNALYVDSSGKLYDYFNGQDDLAAGHVRFIGDAALRIREDVLRILRFFRFYACFGKGAADEAGLAACRDLADLIPQLSIERVWNEIKKLLAADNPAPSWRLMLEAGILDEVLPTAKDVARLESLLAVERTYEVEASSLRRLAGLFEITRTAAPIAQRLKFSKKETAKLQALITLPSLLNGKLDPIPFRRALYEHGTEDVGDAALLLAAKDPALDLEPALALAAEWTHPTFPLQGQDLLKLGMKPGPEIGVLLKTLEQQWIASDFKMTRAECLAAAKKEISLT